MHEKLWKIPTRYGTNISSAFWGAPFIFGKLWIITRSYDYPVVFLCIGPVYIIVVYQSRSISKKQDPLSTRKPPIYYHLAGACLFNKWIWKKNWKLVKIRSNDFILPNRNLWMPTTDVSFFRYVSIVMQRILEDVHIFSMPLRQTRGFTCSY